jgi:hypothetical protein
VSDGVSRRQFLTAGSFFGWLPFIHPKHIQIAGARFRIVRNGKSRRRYILIHGDEETAREVLTRHMKARQGIAFLVENKTRNVPAGSGKIDPNRMFSREGAARSLERLNPGLAANQMKAALAEIEDGLDHFLRALLPTHGGLLVALHNNSEAYSVQDELAISDDRSIREPQNPHAFFLCTEPADFKILANSGYNVVLQHSAGEDDGSLSRLCARRGIRYVNIEVGAGRAGRQQEMLQWLEWSLP